ncbi:Uncharacterized protein OS=Singulisphaera acidiphila (strain ATCC BAA-1392 / DSM 18658 / VKM B-2454 / MOB10) GN=Sinac_5817 PE=4 SV=1 [Gemmataceae bacterium]|nr:Uncharacterized protein OS=Singulisphaera acidiphila (strain ATCC BAA-1392 / DSM 18658 / VKM B-2454 / MOB10) GN=Sinac_5817 PE=4 SV=1 [Gemmataceae bacterium]VTU00389.1 Uncharacterized protein OS=Singulisphaera acidiphila (strain ATCC BAA-1392 / DSM 18658 / VKM B-2454 / MOB10) GN=Sinac_5817 PE=4 SV=1 [Gemmataceae bacterium]
MNLATAFRVRVRVRVPRAAGARAPTPRRRAARRAVLSGAAALAALTAGMAVALDVGRPQWRDPEFYVRLDRLKRWQAEAPDRPLVVAFGSSRTQNAINPAAMGYPDRPGSPLVFNMGYRGARPLAAYLHFTRTLDAGVRPRAVLFQIATSEVGEANGVEGLSRIWAPRLSIGDMARFAPYSKTPTATPPRWLGDRLKPWATYRVALVDEWAPGWLTQAERNGCVWDQADAYGYVQHPLATVTPKQREANFAIIRKNPHQHHSDFQPEEFVWRVLQGEVSRCRAEGVAVAFYWIPNSPAYWSWHPPGDRARVAAYQRRIEAELGAVVFPYPPDDLLAEEDFADGHHFLRRGAEKYSRWLADTHLSPWLRSQGLIGP